MRRKLLFALHFSFFLAIDARAEYRAYQLNITNTATGTSREVASTLDHNQYPGYFTLSPTEQVRIKATWMCWERSDGYQPICPNPKTPTESAGPQAN